MRLGETAKTIPKILLDIAGQTVLARQMQMLKDVNVKEAILASGHLHDVRESSPQLWEQVADGLQDAGVEVLNAAQ